MYDVQRFRTFIFGLLSPAAAALIGRSVYQILTKASANRDHDFTLRLSITALSMTVPFVVTALSARIDRRRAMFATASGIGLALAILSLSLLFVPVRGIIVRSNQAASQAVENIQAPELLAKDLNGNLHRLSGYRGSVVLINLWATWCVPCRREMMELDRLYKSHRDHGLVVLGYSQDDFAKQRAFAAQVPVSYPLLLPGNDVSAVFRDINRYPSTFLVDRHGRLRRAPSSDEPFRALQERVEQLLKES